MIHNEQAAGRKLLDRKGEIDMELTMSREYAKVIAKAWIDPSFKASLMQDPVAVLREYGITLPEGTDFSNFMLPSAPMNMTRDMNMDIHTCPELDGLDTQLSLGIHNCPAPDPLNLGIHNCPAPVVMEEPPAPYDLIHESSLGVVACPAE